MSVKKIGTGRLSGLAGAFSKAPGGLEPTLKKLMMRHEYLLNPAAGNTNVLAQKAADFDVDTGFTQPAHSRNLQVTFGAAWDGGNAVVTGICADGVERSETFLAVAGGNTAVGTVAFAKLTRAYNTGTRGAGTCDIMLATDATTVFGVCARRISEFVKMSCAGTVEAIAAESLVLGTWRPTTVPNAAKSYDIVYLCEEVGDLQTFEEEAEL